MDISTALDTLRRSARADEAAATLKLIEAAELVGASLSQRQLAEQKLAALAAEIKEAEKRLDATMLHEKQVQEKLAAEVKATRERLAEEVHEKREEVQASISAERVAHERDMAKLKAERSELVEIISRLEVKDREIRQRVANAERALAEAKEKAARL